MDIESDSNCNTLNRFAISKFERGLFGISRQYGKSLFGAPRFLTLRAKTVAPAHGHASPQSPEFRDN